MEETDRRAILLNAGLAVTAAAVGEPVTTAAAQAQAPTAARPKEAMELPNDLTRKLARFIVSARFEEMPQAVRHEARR